jgi:sialic acid synthase SpsE
VILSTGASNVGDITKAASYLNSQQTVLLYCVAAYPALHADLRVMDLLLGLHHPSGLPPAVGFSDHTPGIYMAIEAARKGALVIEMHFTAFPELDTPDRPHSLTDGEFKLMVDHIRGKRLPVIGPTPEEKAMLLKHNRRLLAIKDIAEGEQLKFGVTHGAYRSLEDDAHGLSPFAWEQLEGKRATKAIARGKGVGPGDFG